MRQCRVSSIGRIPQEILAECKLTLVRYFISAVEVWSPPSARAFAIIGDSITDGRGSDDNKDDR